MINKNDLNALRDAANVIEGIGRIARKNPDISLEELAVKLRTSIDEFEPIELPEDLEKRTLIELLFHQLNLWKKDLKNKYKAPIARFAEEHKITKVKASTLTRENPIYRIVAEAFEESIKTVNLQKAVQTLQEKGYVVKIQATDSKRTGKKLDSDATDSDHPFKILS